MKTEGFLLGATLTRAVRKVDRSLSLSFTTNLEISSEEFEAIDQMHMSEGWLQFAPTMQFVKEVPSEDVSDKQKSQSKRLRNVLFLIWESDTSPNKLSDFEAFYRTQMDIVINHFKLKLPPQ